jgi:hypothetical protein
VVEVEFLDGNGFIYEDLDYLVSLVDKVQDIPPPVWGSITGDIEDQTDLIDYISSQVTTPTLQEVTDAGNVTTNAVIVENTSENERIEISDTQIKIYRDFDNENIQIGSAAIQISNDDSSLTSSLEPNLLSLGNSGFGINLSCNVLTDAHNIFLIDESGDLPIYTEKVSNFTAVNSALYSTNGTITVTDPAPVTNKGYIVYVIDGTTTIGGVGYTAGALIYRFYNGSAWISTDMNAGGTTPTLQEVTDEGAITTNDITVNSIELTNGVIKSNGDLLITDLLDNPLISLPVPSFTYEIAGFTLTASRNYILPDASGTIALTTDIPVVTGYVPYTGATTNVDLGANSLTAKTLTITDNTISNKDLYLNGTYPHIVVGISDGFIRTEGIALYMGSNNNIITFSSFNSSGARTLDWASFNRGGSGSYLNTRFNIGTNTDLGYTLGVNGSIYGSSFIKSGGTSSQYLMADGSVSTGGGTVTSVGLTMPSAFIVTNSPITSSGDIAVTGAGLVSQYVRGDGTLANFPNSTGGGSSVNYYLNGSVSQGTFGGDTYYEMSKTPILGAGTNFTRTNGAGNGYIASFITDAGDPSFLNIPGGNWNVEFYFQSSATGGSPQFYAEIYKVSATNVFTLVASGSANPEGITNGTTVDQYFTSIPVPQTSLLITDRLAVRIYVITSGRTITLHTENGNLCEVLTTFTTGLTALNGLTAQVQNLAVGTSGTDFAISSATDTHTFNLPTASATNRGALSSTDWSTFNNKQNALGFTAEDVANKQTDLTASATKYPTVNAVNTGLALKQNALAYTPFKFVQTSQTAHTGTVAETIIATATINGGTFNSSDVIKLLFKATKTNTSAATMRLKINTTNTLVGATQIGLYNFTTLANTYVLMSRTFDLQGGNLFGYNFTSSLVSDVFNTNTVGNSTTYNTANTLYLFFTLQSATILDTVTPNLCNLNN